VTARPRAHDDLERAIRNGAFDERGLDSQRDAIARTSDYLRKPAIDRFADRGLPEVKTADIEDVIADLSCLAW